MLQRFIDFYLSRTRPADETVWHKWRTIWGVRLVDGSMSRGAGQLWRRLRPDGTYEYQQDEETQEEYDARQY